MEQLRAFTQSMVITKPGQPPRSSLYASLPNPNSIRLLDILPACRGRPIETTLKVTDVNHAPSFEALSYVWGSPENTVNILCNGTSMTVTPNLGAALQRLRHRFRRRTVWIDALCINQNDLEERAQQVSFMKDIYARARHVVVWLGDNNVDARMSAVNVTTAISIIRQCAKHAYEEVGIGNQVMPQLAIIEREDKHSDLKLGRKIPQPGDIKWGAVLWFYQLPWFSRVLDHSGNTGGYSRGHADR
jgi:hypothetical protein